VVQSSKSSLFPPSMLILILSLSSLSKNHEKGVVGGVTPDTYVAFLIIECMALPLAFLISPLERVVRSDGTRILVSEKIGTMMELKQIKFTMTSKLILLSALWAIWSFFYRLVTADCLLKLQFANESSVAPGRPILEPILASALVLSLRSYHLSSALLDALV
jgi:hypothetical protein